MAKPILQFRSLSGPQLAQYADNILVKMTENAIVFPDPDPSLADLESVLTLFNRSLADAAFRDMRQVEIKNQHLAALRQVIFELSLYVTKVSKGDRAIILAAGFMPSKTAAPIGVAPKPQDFRAQLMLDNPGHVRLRVNAWKPTLVYQFEYRKRQEGEPWKHVLSSKSTCVISGLETLEAYEFRVAYINSDPLVTYSDVVSTHVL